MELPPQSPFQGPAPKEAEDVEMPSASKRKRSGAAAEVQEIHRLAVAKRSWRGKSIEKAAPTLLSAVETLFTGVHSGKIASLVSDEQEALHRDLSIIAEKIEKLPFSKDESARTTLSKIETICQHLTIRAGKEASPETAPAKKVKQEIVELEIPVREYANLEELGDALEAIIEKTQGRQLSNSSLGGLENLLRENRSLFTASQSNLTVLKTLKRIDPSFYREATAKWVDHHRIPLHELKFSESELMELAPFLRRVTVVGDLGTDDFLDKFLENCTELEHLHIENSPFRGTCIDKLVHLNNLKSLEISCCLDFNHPFPEELSSVETLKIYGCSIFDKPLPAVLPKLCILEIEECKAYNKSLPLRMPEIEKLNLSDNRNFDQKLPEEMPHLILLELRHLENFNQQLPNSLPVLSRFIFNHCPKFNLSLPREMPLLHDLHLSNVEKFDQELPKHLPKLSSLFIKSSAFNHPLPEEMAALETLRLERLTNFNQSIVRNLPHLIELDMDFLPQFDQPLPERLPKLNEFKISECNAFNRPLPVMPRLRNFEIKHCKNFHLFDHPPQTVATYINFCTVEDLAHLNPEEKRLFKLQFDAFLLRIMEQNQDFPVDFTNFLDIYSKFGDINDLLMKHPSSKLAICHALFKLETDVRFENYERVEEFYTSLRTKPNFIEFLKVMRVYFPVLLVYMIKNHRQEISNFLQTQDVNVRHSLLPFLSPDMVRKTVSEIPQEVRLGWMQQPAECGQFHGPFKTVFHEICKLSPEQCRELLQELKEIPSFPEAVVATVYDEGEVTKVFFNLIPPLELSIFISLFAKEKLIEFLKEVPFRSHEEILSNATQEQQQFYRDDPVLSMRSTLSSLEEEIKRGARDDEVRVKIRTMYDSLKKQPHFVEGVKTMVRFYPAVTEYLIEQYRDEVSKDIEGVFMNFEAEETSTRLALLPLLSQVMIRKTILEAPPEERLGWMGQHFAHDPFSGSINHVLTQMKQNLDSAAVENRTNVLFALREILQEVPLKALAAMACDEEESKKILALMEAFSDTHLTVIIPLLSIERLIEYLKEQPPARHMALLSSMTPEQQESYMQKDLLVLPIKEPWEKEKANIAPLLQDFTQAPTEEKLAALQEKYSSIRGKIAPLLFQYGSLLKGVRSKFADPESAKAYISPKSDLLAKVEKEMVEMGSNIHENLASRVAPVITIPDEYIDPIYGTPMTDPYTDGYHICDKTTWLKLIEQGEGNPRNPFNREPLDLTRIRPEPMLKEKIEEFKSKHPDVWNRAQTTG